MTRPCRTARIVLWVAALGSSACGPAALFPAVRATPMVEVVGPTDVVAGRAVTLRYTWTLASDFVADRPYRVFVHFIDDRGTLAFTDDHAPPGGIAQWTPGGRQRYERRVILPDDAGGFRVRVGLASGAFPYKARVTDAAGNIPGFPVVAEIRARENPTLAEESVAGTAGFDLWDRDRYASMHWSAWTRRESRFLFLRPPHGGRLQLQGYVPRGRLARDPTVTLRAAEVHASVSVSNEDRFVLELDVPGDGVARLVEGALVSDEAAEEGGREIAVCVERFRVVPLPD